MIKPTTVVRPLTWNRHESFVDVIAIQGMDLSGAAFAFAARQVPDGGTGAPPISATTNGNPNAQGVCLLSVTTEEVDFSEFDESIGTISVPVSYVQVRILEAVANGLVFPNTKGADLEYTYDLQITPAGGDKYRAAEGPFTIHAGVVGSS